MYFKGCYSPTYLLKILSRVNIVCTYMYLTRSTTEGFAPSTYGDIHLYQYFTGISSTKNVIPPPHTKHEIDIPRLRLRLLLPGRSVQELRPPRSPKSRPL